MEKTIESNSQTNKYESKNQKCVDSQLNKAGNGPLLSISMLCNGAHKEETKKCLESLMTIKNRLDSELVIVDTGCDEEMKNLINSYADKVVPFKWCDDFAKARNAGLKECHGKWFMYVDDDEWFENTDDLVDFFKSGKYKNYQHADYIQRNYIDMDGKDYDDFLAGRISQIMDDTHFIGMIHEYLFPLIGEAATIHSFVHHYGYVYKDKQEHMAKSRRNIKPLLKMLKKDPDNLHWYSQLVQEYMAAGLDSSLLDFSEKVIKLLDEYDDPVINKDRADFYYGKLVASNGLYDYDGTIKDFNIFRKDRRNNDICQANLYLAAVSAYFQKKDFSHVLNYGRKYLDIYDKWKDFEDLTEKLHRYGSLTTSYVFSDRNLILIIGLVISSGVEEKETDDLFKYFDYLSDLKSDGSQYSFVWEKIVDNFAESDYDQRFVGIADKLLSYEELAINVSARAKKIEEDDKDEKEKTERLIKIFGQTKNGRNYYLDYLRFLYEAEYGGDRKKLSDRFSSLISMTTDFFNFDPKLWQKAEEKSLDIADVFKRVPLKKWYRVVNGYLDRHDEEQTKPVVELMTRFSSDGDVRFVFFRLKLKEKEVINQGCENNNPELILEYCKDCISFYSNIYSRKQFEEEASLSMLPSQAIFAIRYLETMQKDGHSAREKELKKCLGIYEPFDPVIRDCLKREKAAVKKAVFIFYKADDWKKIEPLWKVVDHDDDFSPVVIPVPFYDKNADGTLGEYHFERENLPDGINSSYFADIELNELHPDVIFIFEQMDGGNPAAAVPAQYYVSELQKYTKMLIFVPLDVLNKEKMAEKIFVQVKEQLKKQ